MGDHGRMGVCEKEWSDGSTMPSYDHRIRCIQANAEDYEEWEGRANNEEDEKYINPC